MSAVPEPCTDHLVRQLRGGRTLRWVFAVLGAYNVVVAAEEASWVRTAVWVALTAWVIALQLVPWRGGTRVEPHGVRVLAGWWVRPLVPWGAVVTVRVQGPYDTASSLEVTGRRPVRLPGMAPDAVRALAAEHGLPVCDPVRDRQDATASLSAPPQPPQTEAPAPADLPDGSMDGPFRRS